MFGLPTHPRRLMFTVDTSEAGAGSSAEGTVDESTADDATKDEAKDWKAEFEAQQAINRSLERKVKKDLARITAFEAAATEAGKVTDAAPDVDKLRAEIRAEVTAESHKHILAARAETALKGAVNISPARALKLLDLSEVEVDANGNVDTEALSDAVAKLLKDEPHLAIAQGTRFQGSADQGSRGASKSTEQELTDALAEATAARNFTAAIGIRQRIAALAATKH